MAGTDDGHQVVWALANVTVALAELLFPECFLWLEVARGWLGAVGGSLHIWKRLRQRTRSKKRRAATPPTSVATATIENASKNTTLPLRKTAPRERAVRT